MSGWSVLFWLIVTFLLMHPLQRWISAHMQGVAFLLTNSHRTAMWLFWVLFLPGTVLHEVSHWITALLLGVRAGRLSLWPTIKKKGELQMGAVQVDMTDPFRHSLIGLAPLIFGSIVVLMIGQGRLELGQLGQALASGDLEMIGEGVARTLSMPDVWLWLYLLFAVANAMLPSASDRESWRTVFTYLALALALTIGLGLNPGVSPQFQEIVLAILTYLVTAFAITIAVDFFFMLLILLLELGLSWLLGRRVQYHHR